MTASLPDDLKRFLFLVPYAARRSDGVGMDELCAKLDLSQDDLRKLLDRVASVGTPDGTPDEMVEVHVDSDRVRVALPQRFTSPPRFSVEEVVALLLVLSPLRTSALPELAASAAQLTEKLLALASEPAAEVAPDIVNRVVVEGERTERAEHLELLERAVRERRAVVMEYYTASRDALSERVLRPCGLLQHRGAWYTVGHDERLFKVERIKRLALTDERFDLPPGFDLERYRPGLMTEDRRPFDVVVRTGDRTRTFPAWSRPQTKSWMRTAAGATELIEPADLRRELVTETRELLARYRNPG